MVDILLEPNILYESEGFLVIEKPAGLLVHSTKYQKKNTLVDWLLKYYPEIKNIGAKERPGIVHRLDRNVSGLMIVARTKKAYQHFIEQFKNNRVKKEYLALVFGKPPQEKGTIDLPIGRSKKGKIVAVRYRKKIKLEKNAITEYRVIKKFTKSDANTSPRKLDEGRMHTNDTNFTLLKVRPLTGRTHQIRIHLASIGTPIIGDKEYLPKRLRTKVPNQLNRIFLHACYLGFTDLSGQRREFSSQLPKELTSFLTKLEGGFMGSKLFVISGLSGAGKDSVVDGLKEAGLDYTRVITATTRSMRTGESEGNPYHFVSVEKFKEMIENKEFFEWARVYDNYYGNSKKVVNEALASGKPVILRIDCQGAKTIKEKIPETCVIFIVPPSIEILEARLRKRGTDSEEVIRRRLVEVEKESQTPDLWDHVIVNEEGKLAETVEKVKKIILKEARE